MTVRTLNHATLASLKLPATGQVELVDASCPGLRLRASAKRKTWILGCRDAQGRARRFSLGQYPDMGLAEAREEARALRPRVRAGEDPIAERRRMRQAATLPQSGARSFQDLIDAYAAMEGASKRTWPEMRRRVTQVFGKLLARPAAELTGPDIQLIADAHPSRSSANAAVRYLRPVLKWGVKRGAVQKGLAQDLDSGRTAPRRERVLQDDELASLLTQLRSEGGSAARCLQFVLWTAARLTEAAGATWSEIDLSTGVWVIPANRHKSGRGHRVILPRQAREALECWRAGASGAAADLVFATRTGKRLSNWDRVTKLLHGKTHTQGWQRHDLRRTVATIAGRLGHAPHAVEAMLGHLIGSSTGDVNTALVSTYNLSRYEREAGLALQAVADELDRLAAGPDNVVRLWA